MIERPEILRVTLEAMRADLRAAISREREHLARPVEEPSDRSGQHAAETAAELFDREFDLMAQRTLERELAAVDDALVRLDAGTYGVCAECERPIEPERLEVRPQAIRRVECERRHRSRRPTRPTRS